VDLANVPVFFLWFRCCRNCRLFHTHARFHCTDGSDDPDQILALLARKQTVLTIMAFRLSISVFSLGSVYFMVLLLFLVVVGSVTVLMPQAGDRQPGFCCVSYVAC
jgi:hypothetical protein